MIFSVLPPRSNLGFFAYRPDDAAIRALQSSQVALHEYRLAYQNLKESMDSDSRKWAVEQRRLVGTGTGSPAAQA
jgi:hypothetical protein